AQRVRLIDGDAAHDVEAIAEPDRSALPREIGDEVMLRPSRERRALAPTRVVAAGHAVLGSERGMRGAGVEAKRAEPDLTLEPEEPSFADVRGALQAISAGVHERDEIIGPAREARELHVEPDRA